VDKLVEMLTWLESHNKNYTKEQYFKIRDCLELAKEQRLAIREFFDMD